MAELQQIAYGGQTFSVPSGGDHVELTQSEYDALSQEEKNNGSVYFITDGFSATTVDQTYSPTSANAQSGVAVAEALESKSATGTWVSSIATGYAANFRKSGNVVTFMLNGRLTTSVAGSGAKLVDLPQGFEPAVAQYVTYSGAYGSQTNATCLLSIRPDGGIYTATGSGNVSEWVQLSGAYII